MIFNFFASARYSETKLAVIIVPATDFSGSLQQDAFKKLCKDTLGLSVFITQVSAVKKVSAASQHPLLSWLTDIRKNKHFNADVETAGEVFHSPQGVQTK